MSSTIPLSPPNYTPLLSKLSVLNSLTFFIKIVATYPHQAEEVEYQAQIEEQEQCEEEEVESSVDQEDMSAEEEGEEEMEEESEEGEDGEDDIEEGQGDDDDPICID